METKGKKSFIINAFYYILIFAIVFVAYRFVMGYLWPFVIAFLLVMALRKPSVFIAEKLKCKVKYVSIVLVLLCFMLLIFLLGIIVFVLLKKIESGDTVSRLKKVIDDLSRVVGVFGERIKNILPLASQNTVISFLEVVPQKVGEVISGAVAKVVSSLPKLFLGFAVSVAAGCYFSNEYEPLKNFLFSIISQNNAKKIKTVKKAVAKNAVRLLKGYGITAALIFAVCFTALLILGYKNAFFVAIFIAFVDILPVLGAGTVLVPWGVFSALSGKTLLCVVLAVCYILTLIIHHVIEPKIVGEKVGVPPLISLLVIFTALRIFGFFGMFISVLALITVVDMCKNDGVSN